MECSAILLFPNANRQSFVAVTRAGGRKYLKSSEKSHLRPRHEARRNARVESTWSTLNSNGDMDVEVRWCMENSPESNARLPD
eukprot:scaffold5262_cov137-Skeletonema_dohrnii-CCMP3373.AAC.1